MIKKESGAYRSERENKKNRIMGYREDRGFWVLTMRVMRVKEVMLI